MALMERSAEIEDAVRRFYDAMARGDVAAVDELIADDAGVVFVGTDAQEWWAGRKEVTAAFRAQLDAMGKIEMIGAAPQGYADGDTGWAIDRPSFRLPDGTEVTTRLTAVARREHGDWHFVHTHISTGAPQPEFG